MNRRIKKRFRSICKALLTVPVSYARCGMIRSGRSVGALMPSGRLVSARFIPATIVGGSLRSTAKLTLKRSLLKRSGTESINRMQVLTLCSIKEKAAQGHRASVKAATVVLKVLGTFPCATKPVQPAITELLSYSNNLTHESVSNQVSTAASSGIGTIRPERRVVRFARPSKVGHGLSVQLARDDLDSILTA